MINLLMKINYQKNKEILIIFIQKIIIGGTKYLEERETTINTFHYMGISPVSSSPNRKQVIIINSKEVFVKIIKTKL